MTEDYRSMPKVVKVIDPFRIAINRGEDDGVKKGAVYLIFGIGERISDPDTGDDLGLLELVRGKAKVTHVQKRLATLESIEYEITPPRTKKIKRLGGVMSYLNNLPAVEEIVEGEERDQAPLNASVGDVARPA